MIEYIHKEYQCNYCGRKYVGMHDCKEELRKLKDKGEKDA